MKDIKAAAKAAAAVAAPAALKSRARIYHSLQAAWVALEKCKCNMLDHQVVSAAVALMLLQADCMTSRPALLEELIQDMSNAVSSLRALLLPCLVHSFVILCVPSFGQVALSR